MNPVNNIKFIQKIMEYSLSNYPETIINRLDIYIKVNGVWEETIINYMNFIWYGKNHLAIWNYAVCNLQSDKFWENFALQDDTFFKELNKKFLDNDIYWCSDTIWHDLVQSKKSEKFWDIIANKPDIFFNKFWRLKNKNGFTVWHRAVNGNISTNFWEIIAQKDDEFFKSWEDKSLYRDTVWHCSFGHWGIKSVKFWNTISQKNKEFFKSWYLQNDVGESIWDIAKEHLNFINLKK
jgi:hypothetical protein